MGKTKGGGPGSGRVTQSWEKRKFVSKNKVRQLSCRYCKKPIAAQNYSRHLQTAHKDEWDANPGDLREFGDRAISFFNPGRSGGGRQSKTAGAAGGGGGVAVEGEAGGGGEAIGEGGEKSYQDSLVLPSLLYLARYYIHIYSSLQRFRCYSGSRIVFC